MTISRSAATSTHTPTVLAFVTHDRARDLLKRTLPRKRARLLLSRTATEFALGFKREVVDAAVVDVGQPSDDTWKAAALAREFTSTPFFWLSPLRVADGAALGRCVEYEFADILGEGIDESSLAEMVLAQGFTARFAGAMAGAGEAWGLESVLQLRAWRAVIGHGGRLLRTETVARERKV